jgi:hypothetical protein
MSTNENTLYLENMAELYFAGNKEERAKLAEKMTLDGFNEDAQKLETEFDAEKKLEWLQDHGMSFADVLCDDDGVEYVLSEEDNGNPGEDGYSAGFKRIDLPNFND